LQADQELPRVLSAFSATMLGVGAMIGAGIFVLSGIAAGHAGPALLLSFLLNGLIAMAIGACYAELASAMPRAGGSYFWVKQALGPSTGFFVGWISLYANVVAAALYALGFGAFLSALIETAGVTFPAVNISLIAALCSTAGVTLLHYRGTTDTTLAENSVTLIKIFLLLVLVVGGFVAISRTPTPLASFQPFAPNGWSGVVMAMAVIFVAFQGFEVITRTGEELRNPGRDMPRAIFASVAITVSLYLLIGVVLIGAIHGPGGQPAWQYLGDLGELGMATSARQLLPRGDVIFYCAGIASTASAMIAATFSAIRVTFALGRANDLPAGFARLHETHHSPHRAALLCGGLVALMVVSLPMVEVAGAASQMFALLFGLVCVAAWRLRRSQPEMLRPFRAPLLPLLAATGILAGILVFFTLLNISPIAWSISCLWLVGGAAIYWMRR
jgi:amino acid transporter